jgi:predicted permease
MLTILGITLPFFALILCGGVAARLRWLPAGAVPGLNVFVLYFALPCMLLRFGMRTPVRELLDPAVLALYAGCALAVVALALHWGGAGQPAPDAAFGALVAAFPNSGFIGVPLLAALLGSTAAGPVIGSMLVDMVLTSSLCIALAQQDKSDWGRLLRRPLTNPLPWAIAAGALLSALQWQLPGPVDTLVRMLGDAASPVALFTVGALLAGTPAISNTRGVLSTVLLKLLLHPALVWLLGNAAMALGISLDRSDLVALTLAAALPSASNVTLLAQRYGADGGRVARIVLISTVLAFISFTTLAWSFGATAATGK